MGKKLRFWTELYSEEHEFDTWDELMLSAEEWDALSEKDKYDLVEDWAEGQLHCGYEELGEEQTLEEEIDEELEFAAEEEVEEYPDDDSEFDEWSDD